MGNYFKRYILFSTPSFLEGMSRVLDIGNTLDNYNYSDTPEEADTIAIYSDWVTTGDDIKTAIKNYDEEKVA